MKHVHMLWQGHALGTLTTRSLHALGTLIARANITRYASHMLEMFLQLPVTAGCRYCHCSESQRTQKKKNSRHCGGAVVAVSMRTCGLWDVAE